MCAKTKLCDKKFFKIFDYYVILFNEYINKQVAGPLSDHNYESPPWLIQESPMRPLKSRLTRRYFIITKRNTLPVVRQIQK